MVMILDRSLDADKTHLAGEIDIRNLHDGSQIGITCMHYLMPPQLLGALYFLWSECTIFVDLTSNRIALCLMVLGEGVNYPCSSSCEEHSLSSQVARRKDAIAGDASH